MFVFASFLWLSNVTNLLWVYKCEMPNAMEQPEIKPAQTKHWTKLEGFMAMIGFLKPIQRVIVGARLVICLCLMIRLHVQVWLEIACNSLLFDDVSLAHFACCCDA